MKVPNWRLVWEQQSTTLQLLFVQVLTAGTAFLVNILSASAMAPEGRGYLALLVQVTYVLSVAVMLGIERPFIAARRSGFGEALYELVRLLKPSYLIFVMAAVTGLILMSGTFRGLLPVVGLVFIYLLGNVSSRLVRTGYIASGRVSPFLVVSISTQLALVSVAVFLFLTADTTPETWFLAYGISGLIALLVVVYALVRNAKGRIRRSGERLIRREGFKLLPASFGNTAMLRSDRLLLPLLASNAQLGIYVVVATTMELASWPIQNWVDASLNKWRNQGRGRGVSRKLLVRAVLATGVLAGAMGIASILLIQFVLDPSYAESIQLIAPLGAAAVIYAASRVQQGLLIASGESSAVSWTEIIGMGVSVVSYILLIPLMGALGAAFGSAIGYSACFLASVFYTSRRNIRTATV